MNDPTLDQPLDDLLDAYVAATGAPSHAALTDWVRLYPHYAAELTEFTAQWSLLATLPPPAGAPTPDEALLVQRGMASLQALLQRPEASAAAQPLTTILDAGRARGLSVHDLAGRAGLSVALVLKLDRRLVRAATIPAAVVAGLAQLLGRDVAAVSAYLQQGGPRFASGASYHAPQTPALAGQEDFAAAVRADLSLPEDRRAALLALADAAAPREEP
jgi:hypothetical protein